MPIRNQLHYVSIIDSGHKSTLGLFELGLSFGICKRKRHWPSLATMNSFLKKGTDDGALGVIIEWPSFEFTQEEYQHYVTAFMKGTPFKMDTENANWEEWLNRVYQEPDAPPKAN